MTCKSLPLVEYRLPIYKTWDEKGYLCPHNPGGWVAYHNDMISEHFLDNEEENAIDT